MNKGIIIKIQNKYKIYYYGNNRIDRNECASTINLERSRGEDKHKICKSRKQLYCISLIIGAVQLELFQNGTLNKKFRFLNQYKILNMNINS